MKIRKFFLTILFLAASASACMASYDDAGSSDNNSPDAVAANHGGWR